MTEKELIKSFPLTYERLYKTVYHRYGATSNIEIKFDGIQLYLYHDFGYTKVYIFPDEFVIYLRDKKINQLLNG